MQKSMEMGLGERIQPPAFSLEPCFWQEWQGREPALDTQLNQDVTEKNNKRVSREQMFPFVLCGEKAQRKGSKVGREPGSQEEENQKQDEEEVEEWAGRR